MSHPKRRRRKHRRKMTTFYLGLMRTPEFQEVARVAHLLAHLAKLADKFPKKEPQ